MIKQVFDKTVAAVLIVILLLPVLLPIWLIIRLTSSGDAIYRQKRVGKGCRVFEIYKFRSMVAGADLQGYQTMDGDARITPIGHFIRKTSLDELPQLFNVLKGEMSLVGPRPDTPMQEAGYKPEDWQFRHKVLPGITGLAQVSGRSDLSVNERLFYDLEYVRTHHFLLDIKILFKTVWIAVRGKGSN